MTSHIDPRARSGDATHPSLRPIGADAPKAMGYQPSLDGVRAVSVIAVLLYHGGFSWMHGGFFGVEVFFVVSGFLITSLLLDERERSGRIALGQFWLRRARRLLPALALVLLACGVYAALWGDALMRSDLRRDFPWALGYAANWGQIVGEAQYFGNLSPLRHLWSLAVEEQWYLVWPVLFMGLAKLSGRMRVRALVMITLAVAVMAGTWWMAREPQLTDERVNLLYLSTLTRSSGLLLGAGAAFVWRPWRTRRAAQSSAWWLFDLFGVAAIGVLGWQFVDAVLTDRSVYRWQLALVSVASLVLVMVVVHPASRVIRAGFAWRPVAAIGKRSYGLYLWSWPISVVCEAYTGSWSRFVVAMGITAVVAEISYRAVETPIRRGAVGRWFASLRTWHWRVITGSVAVASLALVAPLVVFFAQTDHVDPAAGGAEAVFVLPADAAAVVDPGADVGASSMADSEAPTSTGSDAIGDVIAASGTEEAAAADEPEVPGAATASTTDAASATTADSATGPTTGSTAPRRPTVAAPVTTVAPPATAPVLPRRVVVVGDSMAHSLAINLPDGIDATFDVADGSVDGCSVYDAGEVRSARRGFSRSFANCEGWAERWADAANDSGSNLALVVIGAWDVFDVAVDDVVVPFASAEGDARFRAGLQQGIDALVAEGAHVALLEIACMRPVDVDGAGVPALPERGDDERVAHLNDLLRAVADEQPEHVTFVPGPAQWCADDPIATDTGYRWDGVHVYKPGANLVYMTIAQALLDIPL